jgi:hypothetical protein
VKQNLPWVTTFDTYFKLAPEERARRRSAQSDLLPDRSEGTCGTNYEAHQAPLAYGVLAPIDALLRHSSLLSRVWYLRAFWAISSCLATGVALWLLGRRLHLEPLAGYTVIFVVFSSQMFYASTAHIANDWLAVPLMVFVFERLLVAWENPSVGGMTSLEAEPAQPKQEWPPLLQA